jgi:hypothetical protein
MSPILLARAQVRILGCCSCFMLVACTLVKGQAWKDLQAMISACLAVEGMILAQGSMNFFVNCDFLGPTLFVNLGGVW